MWSTILGLTIAHAPQLVADVIAEIEKSKPTRKDWKNILGGAIQTADEFIAKESAALTGKS